jgi:HEAT repeat protein
MRLAGCATFLAGLSLASGCFQQEAPRLAAPTPAPTSRQQAATVSPPAMPASKALASALQDSPDPEDRRDAIYEIADAEGDDMESAALIGAALYDPEPDVRLSAVQALTGLRSEAAADWLSIALGDPDARVRRTAVEALGEIGGPNAKFMLQQALGDVDPAVREAAQEMLAEPARVEPGVS